MSNKGGARAGAGRKPVHDEIHARDLSVAAIIRKFGSLEDGLVSLLESNEPSLIKFVFEHAIGKPREKSDITPDGEKLLPETITIKVLK